MEGLAQAALWALSDPDALHPDLRLLERYRDYVSAVLNDAQIDTEAGLPLDEAVASVMRACPLLRRISVRSNLRDRLENPLYRTYVHVYPPSRALFLRAVDLEETRRRAFFREAWTRLLTPVQLESRLP